MSRTSLARLSAAALLLILSPGVAAQAVSGELVDRAGQPVRAARVVLLDSAGVRQASTLTDARGAFHLASRAAGRHLVRAERVGFSVTTSSAVALRAGETSSLRMVASANAITLEGITARAGNRCGRETSPETALIWEEARKALAAAEEAMAGKALQYDFVAYRRHLETGSLAVRSEERATRTATVSTPFGSTPLDTLLRHGFVRSVGDSVAWDAPDGRVLLSQRFVDTHCMQVAAHPDSAALVGLAFRPASGRRLPDVEGTLWLDRATSMLRYLEYRYVNAGVPGRHGQVGGRLEFDRLDSGHWLVRRWRIRMPTSGPADVFPRMQTTPPSSFPQRTIVRSLVEVGGEVTAAGEARLSLGEVVAPIAGVVWDSLRGAPLEEATVSVVGTSWTARSDSAGRFQVGPLPPGSYRVSFTHPLLAAAQVPGGVVEVVMPGDTGRILELATPSAGAIAATACPRAPPRTALVLGRVSSAGRPAENAEITVSWSGLSRDREGVDQQRLGTRSGVDGTYVLCGVPDDVMISLVVRWNGRSNRTSVNLRGAAVRLHNADL